MNDTITCLICQRTFKYINNKHLASHDITSDEYKTRFPGSSLMSVAIAHRFSERSVASNISRKGVPRTEQEKAAMKAGQARVADRPRPTVVVGEAQKLKQSETMKTKYQNGYVHPNQGKHHSAETKARISQSLSGVAQGPERALKAIETKRASGYDLAIFRGRTHSDEAKAKIGQKSTKYFDERRPLTREPMHDRITNANLTLLNDITDDQFRLQCNVCGYVFHRNHQMFDPAKYRTTMCDQCYPISKTSAAEREIRDTIARWLPDQKIIGSDMEQISPLEMDVFLPDLNIAIEYNGLYRHSELAGKKPWYHRFKFNACKARGIKLITIFEDEWSNKRDIVESMLWNGFGLNTMKIDARKSEIIELGTETTSAFLDQHHIMGHGRSTAKYGLLYDGELMSVMTFSNGELSRKLEGWEINRFATRFDTTVRGGASRLFRRFVRDHHPKKVISYADLRFGEGNVYKNLGFVLSGLTVPGYWYFRKDEIKRYHRFALRKTPNDPKDMTEWDIRQSQGWNRIWDCGHARWVWSIS